MKHFPWWIIHKNSNSEYYSVMYLSSDSEWKQKCLMLRTIFMRLQMNFHCNFIDQYIYHKQLSCEFKYVSLFSHTPVLHFSRQSTLSTAPSQMKARSNFLFRHSAAREHSSNVACRQSWGKEGATIDIPFVPDVAALDALFSVPHFGSMPNQRVATALHFPELIFSHLR